MEKIIIWGAGSRTTKLLKKGFFKNQQIIGIVDSFKEGRVHNITIKKPDWIRLAGEYDYLVIMVEKYEEIFVQALRMGISVDKILITYFVNSYPFDKKWDILCTVEPMFADRYFTYNRWQKIRLNEKDCIDNKRLLGNGIYNSLEYMGDYYRYRTFEYIADELLEQGIDGELAEFGVFRGTFASFISRKFPTKKIYLFDTFEGFDKMEGEKENLAGNCDEDFLSSHKNTSVEKMLEVMPYKKNCVVCKGLFPQSVTQAAEKEHFAFVSIDVDFEESTYEGLKFFYPRLVEGGIIFLHDYNSAYLRGVKEAVLRYEEELGYRMKRIPISDRAGTLIIMK